MPNAEMCVIGGLWYYANPLNLTAYANLSYLDGMYSYAPFTALLPTLPHKSHLHLSAALADINLQTAILWNRTYDPASGLLKHGYDALLHHSWAAPMTGSSPIVWSRSLGWYTTGLVDALAIAIASSQSSARNIAKNPAFREMQQRFSTLAAAEVAAVCNSTRLTNRTALWQVVTAPGEPGNFVESSGSALIAYALARGVRLGFLDKREGAAETAMLVFEDLARNFVVRNANGTLSFNGTSAVATLSGNVDYEVSVSSARMMLKWPLTGIEMQPWRRV